MTHISSALPLQSIDVNVCCSVKGCRAGSGSFLLMCRMLVDKLRSLIVCNVVLPELSSRRPSPRMSWPQRGMSSCSSRPAGPRRRRSAASCRVRGACFLLFESPLNLFIATETEGNHEKRLRKIPESAIGNTMLECGTTFGTRPVNNFKRPV